MLGEQRYNIENCLSIYALSFATFSASQIYNEKEIREFWNFIHRCHIYFIGFVPKIKFVSARQEEQKLKLLVSIMGDKTELDFSLEPNLQLNHDGEGYFLLDLKNGRKSWVTDKAFSTACREKGVTFDVQYIGQSYGKNGKRDALERLLKHETLQRIAVNGVPENHVLQVLLLELQDGNSVITSIFPGAKIADPEGSRLQLGRDVLFNTTEGERVSLFEASFIRYFQPRFNKEFKNSFPSTNMKLLRSCYRKDFLGISTEICMDWLPFDLCSEKIPAKRYHIANHDLHNDKERQHFFHYKRS